MTDYLLLGGGRITKNQETIRGGKRSEEKERRKSKGRYFKKCQNLVDNEGEQC